MRMTKGVVCYLELKNVPCRDTLYVFSGDVVTLFRAFVSFWVRKSGFVYFTLAVCTDSPSSALGGSSSSKLCWSHAWFGIYTTTKLLPRTWGPMAIEPIHSIITFNSCCQLSIESSVLWSKMRHGKTPKAWKLWCSKFDIFLLSCLGSFTGLVTCAECIVH